MKTNHDYLQSTIHLKLWKWTNQAGAQEGYN